MAPNKPQRCPPVPPTDDSPSLQSDDWRCCACSHVTRSTAASPTTYCTGDSLCNHHRCRNCIALAQPASLNLLPSSLDLQPSPLDLQQSGDEGGVPRVLRRNEEGLFPAFVGRGRKIKRSVGESSKGSVGSGSASASRSASGIGLGAFDREVMKRMSGLDFDGGGELPLLLRTVREREVLGWGARAEEERKKEEKRKDKGKGREVDGGDGCGEDDGIRNRDASRENAHTGGQSQGISLLTLGLSNMDTQGQTLDSDSDDRSSDIYNYMNRDLDEDEEGSWDGLNPDGEEVERIDMLAWSMKEKERKEREKEEEKKEKGRKEKWQGHF